MSTATNSVQSIIRAVRILECISNKQVGKGLAEIAREVDLHIATTRRLLMTLTECQVVMLDVEAKKYRLGVKLFLMANRGSVEVEVKRLAGPYLMELMAKTGETANFVVEDNGEAVYVAQVESRNSLRTANKVGARAPLYCTAAGKILLASMHPADREALLRAVPLRPITSRTITSRTALTKELLRVANTDIAFDNEEQAVGERCIAAPVRNEVGAVVAALSVSGPSSRLGVPRLRKVKGVVAEIGRKLSARLGYAVTRTRNAKAGTSR